MIRLQMRKTSTCCKVFTLCSDRAGLEIEDKGLSVWFTIFWLKVRFLFFFSLKSETTGQWIEQEKIKILQKKINMIISHQIFNVKEFLLLKHKLMFKMRLIWR